MDNHNLLYSFKELEERILNDSKKRYMFDMKEMLLILI